MPLTCSLYFTDLGSKTFPNPDEEVCEGHSFSGIDLDLINSRLSRTDLKSIKLEVMLRKRFRNFCVSVLS